MSSQIETCPTRNVCFTLYISLSLPLSLSLTHSLYLTLSLFLLQFCLDLSNRVCYCSIESSRKQILLRKSYREQSQANSFAQILSRAVANPLESSGESCRIVCFSLSLSLSISLSLSHTCAYLNKASTGSKLQTLSQ